MPGSFADSNVVLYMASADQRKSSIGEHVLGTGCTVSVQVLNAIANVLRRKHRFT
jgi:predicted nucleic acid-binding protein